MARDAASSHSTANAHHAVGARTVATRLATSAVAATKTKRTKRQRAAEQANSPPQPPAMSSPPKPRKGLTLRRRPAEVLRVAVETFSMTDSWVIFYRAILGPKGAARQLFTDGPQMRYWESTHEFAEVLEMLTALRSTDEYKSDGIERQRMITIRIPVSLHEALALESAEHETSVNKLAISKLLVGLDERFVPLEQGEVRGKRPQPESEGQDDNQGAG